MFQIEINTKYYKSNLLQIDNLASEFFGKELSLAGHDEGVVTFEFEEEQHMKDFKRVLDSTYKIKI